jgi:hypothetical protein
MYLYVRSTSQESEWSYICKLGVQSLPVPSQEMSGHVFVC